MDCIKILLSTAFTVFAFMFDRLYDSKVSLLAQFGSNGDFAGVVWCTLSLFIFAFYWKSWNMHKDCQKIELLFSVMFSIFMLIGRTFSAYNSLGMLETQKWMTLFAGMGWCIFFYMLFRWVTYIIGQYQLVGENQKASRQFQLICMAFIFLFWVPQIICDFPGNVPSDGMHQLNMWFGYQKATNHHPWFTTALLGSLMSIGRGISDNAGVFAIILFQFLFCSWAYSYVCLKVDKYVGRKAACFSAIFFAVVPMWGIYASTVLKDTLFFPVFALYFCSFLDVFERDGSISLAEWFIFGVLSLLVCLMRQDGIYRVFIAGIVLLLFLRQRKKNLLCVLVGVCICIFMYNTLIFKVLEIPKGPIRELFSIPIQQTARYSRDHRLDISEKEKIIINKILSYEKARERYDPDISDPVKRLISNNEKKDFMEYLKVWARMGMRHPGTYLQATINNTYKYYYPFVKPKWAYQRDIKGAPINKGLNIYYKGKEKRRSYLRNYDNLWLVIPGISLLSNPGAYTWIVLICIMLLLKRKKYRQLAVFSVLIVHIAICCASPVNGYLRYAMPLMACTPVLLAWTTHVICSKERGNNG